MASSEQNSDSVQKLVSCYTSNIGLTRMTKTTISEGPAALQSKAFNYSITPFVEILQVYESLDSAYRMADMVISDPISWRSIAPLTGHEIFSVSYRNAISPSDSNTKILHFMIHNIVEDPTATSLNGFKKLIIKLVEFPAFKFLMSNQIYKTYPIDERNTPKQRFSDIVKDTLNSIQDFSKWYDVEIEDSIKDSVNFFIPNWLPMKVINYCKKYAISEKKNYPMYIFHIGSKNNVDKPTAYFKPIYSFVEDANIYRAYGSSFQDVNKQDPNSSGKKSYAPTDVIQTSSFDYFDAQNIAVLSGNTEILFDYLNDNKYVASNYDSYLQTKHRGLSPFPIYPFGNGNQWSSFHRSGWNSVEGSINIKNELQNEYALNMLTRGIKCKCMCSIYEGRACGERAELIFNVADKQKMYDEMMSGAWITWSITDHLMNGAAFSTIYFMNDGFIKINDSTNTFNKINTITGVNSPDEIK